MRNLLNLVDYKKILTKVCFGILMIVNRLLKLNKVACLTAYIAIFKPSYDVVFCIFLKLVCVLVYSQKLIN